MSPEEWEERVKRVISETMAPLYERLDAAEARAAEAEKERAELEAKLRKQSDDERAAAHDEVRRRFRASLIVEMLQGDDPHELGEYVDRHRKALTNLERATEAVDTILSRCNLSGGEIL